MSITKKAWNWKAEFLSCRWKSMQIAVIFIYMKDGKLAEDSNPAVRLAEFLKVVAKLPQQDPDRGNNPKTNLDAWAEVFELGKMTQQQRVIEVIFGVRALDALFGEVIDYLESRQGVNRDLYIEPVSRLRRVCDSTAALEGPWNSSVAVHCNMRDMQSLEYLLDLIKDDVEFRDRNIPPDELASILNDIDQLTEAFGRTKLPKKIRLLFQDILEDLRRAVREYRLRGSKGVREAMGRSWGLVIANQDAISEAAQESKGSKDTIEKVANLLHKVEVATDVVKKTYNIFEAVTKALPLLGAGN